MENEAAELAERAANLRAAIARAKMDLRTASEEQRAISARIDEMAARERAAGIGKTTQKGFGDLPTTGRGAKATEAAASSRRVEEPTVLIPQKKKQIQRAAFGMGLAASVGTMLLAGGLVWLASASEDRAPPRAARHVAPDTVRIAEPPGRALAARSGEIDGDALQLRMLNEMGRAQLRAPAPPADLLNAAMGENDIPVSRDGDGARPKRRLAENPADTTGGMGSLTVVCIPRCESIVDNGVELGPGHIFSRPTTAGRHTLVLTGPFEKKAVVVEVLPGQRKDVRMAMGRSNSMTADRL